MGELVRQQAAQHFALVPFGEIFALAAVLAAAMMLQPDAAELVGQREEKFIAVERTGAEQRHRLRHQGRVACDLVGLDRKSVVWGKGVSVRVELGGRRVSNK